DLLVGRHHGGRVGVHLGGHLELVQRTFPLSQHTQQLKEKDPQARVGRLLAHLSLEVGQRLVETSGPYALFSGHRCAPLTEETSGKEYIAPGVFAERDVLGVYRFGLPVSRAAAASFSSGLPRL